MSDLEKTLAQPTMSSIELLASRLAAAASATHRAAANTAQSRNTRSCRFPVF